MTGTEPGSRTGAAELAARESERPAEGQDTGPGTGGRLRVLLWALLGVVAAASAVLSFDALRALGVLCGFAPDLAWLLPVVIDAGAAAGCLAWLRGDRSAARGFARVLTLVLLASSVAGNAVVHALSAYRLAPPWWLLVAVSAVAPAVLGAVVHLAVLVGQRPAVQRAASAPELVPAGGELVEQARRVVELAAARGERVGRGRLAEALDVPQHTARALLAELAGTNGQGVGR